MWTLVGSGNLVKNIQNNLKATTTTKNAVAGSAFVSRFLYSPASVTVSLLFARSREIFLNNFPNLPLISTLVIFRVTNDGFFFCASLSSRFTFNGTVNN